MKQLRTIRNCPLPIFKQQCPMQWEGLQETEDYSVRYCEQCEKKVYFCETDAQTIEHAKAGHCIARMIPDLSEFPTRYVYLGEPDPKRIRKEPPVTAEEEEANSLAGYEYAVTQALKNINAPRDCPGCGFPTPSWHSSCRVCDYPIGRVAKKDSD